MKIEKIKKAPEYVLRLSHEEASWLKAVMQNPIGDSPEDGYSYAMRKEFFEWLKLAMI